MKTHLLYAARLVVLFSVLSLLFNFTTWGQEIVPNDGPDQDPPELVLHGLGHFVFGCLAVWAVRNPAFVIAGGSMALGLDLDHIPSFLGAPTLDRSAHTLVFMLVSSVAMGTVAARGWFGRIPPITVGAMAPAAVMSHIGFDALVGVGHMPLFAPASREMVVFGPLAGLLIQGAAALLVLLAVLASRGWRDAAHQAPSA